MPEYQKKTNKTIRIEYGVDGFAAASRPQTYQNGIEAVYFAIFPVSWQIVGNLFFRSWAVSPNFPDSGGCSRVPDIIILGCGQGKSFVKREHHRTHIASVAIVACLLVRGQEVPRREGREPRGRGDLRKHGFCAHQHGSNAGRRRDTFLTERPESKRPKPSWFERDRLAPMEVSPMEDPPLEGPRVEGPPRESFT